MGTINEKLNYLNETKNQIKNAIAEKGVEVSETDTFRSYANKILDIVSGGGELTYQLIGVESTGTGNATTSGNFVIPQGKTKAFIIAIINTQGGANFTITDANNKAQISYNSVFEKVSNYNGSQNVGHNVRIYDIITNGEETTISVTLGGGSNRFVLALGAC